MAAVLLPVNVNPLGVGGAGRRQGFDQFDQEVKTLILVKARSANIFHWKLNIAINPDYFSYHLCWGFYVF